MNEQISWNLEVAIHPGKLDDFRAVARDLIAKTEAEPDTFDYEWNLSADGTVCHIIERYKNNDAVLVHVQSFGNFATRFMEACHPTRFHVYGTPNDAVKAVLADFIPSTFRRWADSAADRFRPSLNFFRTEDCRGPKRWIL